MGVADKDFAKYKFTLVTSGLFKQPSPVEDGASFFPVLALPLACGVLTLRSEDVLYEHRWSNDEALGLDHIDKRPNKVNAEKGIVMR